MRRMLGLGVALVLAMSLVISGNTASASSTTRWVNYTDPNGGLYVMPGTSCNDPGYQTIQSAVIASISGDRINVCPGTYQEQVTIGSGKNNVQLRSTSVWQAVTLVGLILLPIVARGAADDCRSPTRHATHSGNRHDSEPVSTMAPTSSVD